MSDELIDRKNVERLAQEFHDCDELPITLLSLCDRIEELEAKLAQQDDLVQAAVAAALREAAGIASYHQDWGDAQSAILDLIPQDAQSALDRVVAAERERCAKIVEDQYMVDGIAEILAEDLAAAIRKGGE